MMNIKTLITTVLELNSGTYRALDPIISDLSDRSVIFNVCKKGDVIPGFGKLVYRYNRIVIPLGRFESSRNKWPDEFLFNALPSRWFSPLIKRNQSISKQIFINVYSDAAQGHWAISKSELVKMRGKIGEFGIRMSYFSNGLVTK